MNYTEIRTHLLHYEQEHLLSFYNKLNQTEKEVLLNQLDDIDFKELNKVSSLLKDKKKDEKQLITPIPYKTVDSLTVEETDKLIANGLDLIADNKIAVILLAGGQGTRLGHLGPKGTVKIGNHSLFELQADRISALERITGAKIPWYIMTSPINDKETRHFFKEHHYFNLKPEQIFFFEQKLVPTLNLDGKVMLSSKYEISMSPNGNGGVFQSLKESGALKRLKEQGIKWVFFNNIDNALVKVADPLFIGFANMMGSEVSSKSVEKLSPNEKVGVFCLKNNKPSVVEYSELNEIGCDAEQLVNANIGIHLFQLSFLEKIAEVKLPYHLAHKQIPTVNGQGDIMEPDKPNGYKLERFYFDVLSLASSMSVLQVNREKEFAPIKNKTGTDSLESASQLLFNESLNKTTGQKEG